MSRERLTNTDSGQPTWAETLSELRTIRRWSVKQLALRLIREARDGSVAVPEIDSLIRMIRSWERGEHYPSEQYRWLLAGVFEVGEKRLFEAEAASATPALDQAGGPWLGSDYHGVGIHPLWVPASIEVGIATDRRRFIVGTLGSVCWLTAVTSPLVQAIDRVRRLEGSIGGETMDSLEEAVAHLGLEFLRVRPEQLEPQIQTLLNYAEGLLASGPPTQYRTRLLDVAGWTSGLLANAQYDLGDLATAQANARAALGYGESAGDGKLVAWARNLHGKIGFRTGAVPEALGFVQAGVAAAPERSGMKVRLLGQQAKIHARLGQSDHAIATLRAAQIEYDRLPPTEVRAGLFGISEVHMPSCISAATRLLDEPDSTRRHAQEVIDFESRAQGASRSPSRLALARLDLAVALSQLGRPDDAAHQAGTALKTDRMVSAVLHRTGEITTTLYRRWPGVAEVRNLREEYALAVRQD